jgi:hypothetical protein
MNISSQAEYRRQDYQFDRVRADRLYVPLEPSPAPITAWRWDIIAALTVVALGYVAFPVAGAAVVFFARVLP